jgi:hypothetical protein
MPYLDTRIRHLLREAREDDGKGEAINRYNTVRLCPPPEDKLMELDHGSEKYTYKFKPAPRQNDPVIRDIRRLIRSLNVEHIMVANMNYRVAPTDESSPFWLALPDYTTYCSKLYTFMDDFNEFPLTAWVTFAPGLPGLTVDNLHLKIGQTWILLKDWLFSSARRAEDLSGEMGYRAQRKWWKLNGKHFRLADLPAEMRLKIFEFALGPRIYPLATANNAEVRLGLGFQNWHEWNRIRPSPPAWLFEGPEHRVTGCSAHQPNTALLSVNRQTHSESLQAGWENTRKCFFSPLQLTLVLQANSVPDYNWLNHLVLDFTMAGWFTFFGVSLFPNVHMDNARSLGHLLLTLDKLSTLQLWFRSPHDGDRYYPPGINNGSQGGFICCQRTMVDWIMTFAWPFVSTLPKVTLGGILKKDTKVKWNRLLALAAEDKASVIDQAVEEAAILSTPSTSL